MSTAVVRSEEYTPCVDCEDFERLQPTSGYFTLLPLLGLCLCTWIALLWWEIVPGPKPDPTTKPAVKFCLTAFFGVLGIVMLVPITGFVRKNVYGFAPYTFLDGKRQRHYHKKNPLVNQLWTDETHLHRIVGADSRGNLITMPYDNVVIYAPLGGWFRKPEVTTGRPFFWKVESSWSGFLRLRHHGAPHLPLEFSIFAPMSGFRTAMQILEQQRSLAEIAGRAAALETLLSFWDEQLYEARNQPGLGPSKYAKFMRLFIHQVQQGLIKSSHFETEVDTLRALDACWAEATRLFNSYAPQSTPSST